MADPAVLIASLASDAIAAAFGLTGVDPVVRRSQNDRFGDYQVNAAMALAKQLGRPPREVAEAIVQRLEVGAVCEPPEVAGPGFVNLRLREEFLGAAVLGAAAVSPAAVPQTVVVDYSSPNVAKEMHVGHLRSSVIGDALVRVLGAVGHRVVRQNHLGDWGTQFGMLIEHMVDGGVAGAGGSIEDLNELYRKAQDRFQDDPEFAERARARVVALQSGHEETLALWRVLVAESERHFDAVYGRLGVLLAHDDVRGESFYNDRLADTVAELESLGLLRVDQGALCAFPPGFSGRDGEPLPLIVRKSDGGYGYAATDLAALRYRVRDLGAQRIVYVVDARQAQHFAMLFAVARQAGWLGDDVAAEHVAFGTILGEDGRPFKTRTGDTVRLASLLDEAVERATRIVVEKSPDLGEAEQAAVAQAVGIGAVKYADLANDRVKDYVFSWDRMLAMDGNTAPYLQYAHARIRSILRRAEADGGVPLVPLGGVGWEPGPTVAAPTPSPSASPAASSVAGAATRSSQRGAPILLSHPAERRLALELVSFDGAVQQTAELLQPHRLCTYLFELAGAFTAFYESCPVLRAETEGVRSSRLVLCRLTGEVLRTGLGLLGIEAPDRM